MRWISTILVISLGWTLAHEAVCHDAVDRAMSAWFCHSGPQHDHHSDAGPHHDSDETGHDSDHHDAETHDHLSDMALVKKDSSADPRILPDPVPATSDQIWVSLDLGVEPFAPDDGTHVPESSLPAYVRAHVLLL